MLSGALVMLACYLALAATPPFSLVVVIRLVAGAGEAALIVALYTVATDLTPPERHGEAMSLVTLASYLGLTIGAFALAWVGRARQVRG